MINEDNHAYYRFTGPQRIEKAIHTFEGIVQGLSIDGSIDGDELATLKDWADQHAELSHRHPFNELIPFVHEILSDGVVDEEEQADLLWLCRKFTDDHHYFDSVTADMQRLHGLLHGIIADGKITEDELRGLAEWISEHDHLKSIWPYDEIESLVTAVMSDGVIDAEEHDLLLVFFSEFMHFRNHAAIDLRENTKPSLISGVCAVDPPIEFSDRQFCFTGKSKRCSRPQLEQEVISRGGLFRNSVSRSTNYVIVGADGNPCWAYSCYGRKVEAAVNLRKQGMGILLVHEYDFWDALEDLS
ncbi:MAG: BRCT domain-containing protein [Fuerstiella sp.]